MNFLEIQFQGNRRKRYFNPDRLPFKLNEYAVVETEKGEDLGRVVALGEVDAEEAKRIRYSVLRKAGKPEYARRQKMLEREQKASETAITKIRKHNLPMKLVRTEYQLDGRKVTFYFTAEGRVDFRALVKDLAAELRTRIDLRQIGARDESRKVPGFGVCGRQLCCNTFLSQFDPITTQMAKQQNLPLNPAKLSGNCGRLRCCLQYELDFYAEQMQHFPRLGKSYKTSRGAALVTDADIFQANVRLRFSDGDEETVSLSEFKELASGAAPAATGEKKEESAATEPETESTDDAAPAEKDQSQSEAPEPSEEDQSQSEAPEPPPTAAEEGQQSGDNRQ